MPQLHVFLSEADDTHLREQIETSGLSISSYIRCLIRGDTVKPKPTEQTIKMLHELSAIGNNINQIARVANTTGQVSQEDIQYIKEKQSRLWREIKQM